MTAQVTELHARLIDLFGPQAAADPTKLYGNLTVLPSGLVQIGSSSGLILPDGYTTSITPSGRNRFNNGDCRIAQRASTAFTTVTAGYGGPDRWSTSNSAGGGQFTQSLGTITYGSVAYPAVLQTVNTAWSTFTTTNYWYGINQTIEGYNAWDLMGKPVTVSFLWNSNVSGTFAIGLRAGATNQSCVQTFTASAGPQIITVTFPAIPTSTAIACGSGSGLLFNIGFINAGTYVTATTGTWITGNYLCTAACTNWAATAANYISATLLQLEAGTTATPFETIPYADSLLRCMRYYEVGDGVSGFLWQGSCTNGSAENAIIKYWVPKRTTPTIALVGTGQNSFAAPVVTGTPDTLGFQVVATANATSANGYFQGGYSASADF